VLGISDFTLLKGEPITVAGEVLEHRLFHFRLPFSGWCHVEVIHGGESFVALSVGAAFSEGVALQNALALCGGVPAEHRTDSLSACSATATAPTPATTPAATASSALTWV
jgi:hypothetical protein